MTQNDGDKYYNDVDEITAHVIGVRIHHARNVDVIDALTYIGQHEYDIYETRGDVTIDDVMQSIAYVHSSDDVTRTTKRALIALRNELLLMYTSFGIEYTIDEYKLVHQTYDNNGALRA